MAVLCTFERAVRPLWIYAWANQPSNTASGRDQTYSPSIIEQDVHFVQLLLRCSGEVLEFLSLA